MSKRCEQCLPRGLAAMRTMNVVVRWAAFVTVAAQLLFAHGCHGDEDHELFAVIARAACGR